MHPNIGDAFSRTLKTTPCTGSPVLRITEYGMGKDRCSAGILVARIVLTYPLARKCLVPFLPVIDFFAKVSTAYHVQNKKKNIKRTRGQQQDTNRITIGEKQADNNESAR